MMMLITYSIDHKFYLYIIYLKKSIGQNESINKKNINV